MRTKIIYNGEYVHCRIEDTIIYLVAVNSTQRLFINCAEMHWEDVKGEWINCINQITGTRQRVVSKTRNWIYASQHQDPVCLSDDGLTIDFLKSNWDVAKRELLYCIDQVSKQLRQEETSLNDAASKTSDSAE